MPYLFQMSKLYGELNILNLKSLYLKSICLLMYNFKLTLLYQIIIILPDLYLSQMSLFLKLGQVLDSNALNTSLYNFVIITI